MKDEPLAHRKLDNKKMAKQIKRWDKYYIFLFNNFRMVEESGRFIILHDEHSEYKWAALGFFKTQSKW